MVRNITGVVIAVVIAGCAPSDRGQMVSTERRTLNGCVDAIQQASGYRLAAARNTPQLVSGVLEGTDRFFSCERIVSGTKGVYYKAVYEEAMRGG